MREAFERMRRLLPGNPFLHIPAGSPGGPQELTYEQTGAAVDEIIAQYREAGHSRHHHVALVLEARAEFLPALTSAQQWRPQDVRRNPYFFGPCFGPSN